MGKNVFEGCYWLTVYCDMVAIPSEWAYDWDKDVNEVILLINLP
jgi:hypothetical protein